MQSVFNPNGVALGSAFSGYLLGSRTVITATGTTTYTPPAGCKYVFIEITGGGGGGGAPANSSSGQITVGTGGGSGTYAAMWLAMPIPSLSIVVGVGGNTSGGSGGLSQVSYPAALGATVLMTAAAGTGGNTLATGTAEAFVAAPNPIVAPSNGHIRVAGNAGGAGHRVSGTVAVSGQGAHGPWGGGGAARLTNGAGNAGGNYGSGGGGGLSINAGGAQNGGAGGQGVAIVSEFY